VSSTRSIEPEARRRRARAVLGGGGLVLLAATFGRVYSGWTTHHYAPLSVPALVDLNRDGADLVAELPGIGPTLAARIVAERAARGPFRDLADVSSRVDGVGPRTVAPLDGRVLFGR
jgi:competence protein ComEA